MPMQRDKTGKNLLRAFLALLAYEVTISVIIHGGAAIFSPETLESHYFMADTFAAAILMFVYIVWLTKISRWEHKSFVSDGTFQNVHLMISLPIIALGLSAISGIWLSYAEDFLQEIPLIADSLESFDETWSTLGNETYIWELLSIVIIGPIVEELLFRGVVYHYLEKIRGGWFPIILSAVAFGVWHGEPVQIVYTAVIGVAYGMIYTKTRDLRVTIILHVLNNFLSTLPPAIDTPQVQEMLGHASYLMIIPALAIVLQIWSKHEARDSISQ